MRIPVITIVFLFVFSFLIDLYISIDAKNTWRKRGFKVYWLTSLLCYALLIVAISLPRRDIGSGLEAVMWLLYTYLTIYVGKLAYLVVSVIGRCVSLCLRMRSLNYPFRWIAMFFGVALMAVMWIGAGYTRRHIIVADQTIYSQKLPASFEDYRIVQISDLHVGTWGNDSSFLSKLVTTVNDLQPDMIVFTGDIVNRESGELRPFLNVLKGFKAEDGVYSILGNHDYGDYVDWDTPQQRVENNLRLAGYQRGMGWHLLNNDRVFIHRGNDSIMLLGVENWGEPPFPTYGDLELALPSAPGGTVHQNDSNFKILLSHNPEHWNRDVADNTNIDLTLSGHTHAWQTMIKTGNKRWSPAKYRYTQWGGRYFRKNKNGEPTQLYVNIGAGSVGMPARLMSAYPEVTLITLKRGEPR